MDPRSNSLADLLRRTAARDGAKVALIAGEVRQTYGELDAEASRVANALADRGVRQGDRVALLARNCREYVVLVFAAAKLGAVLVPVNFMLTGADVAFVLEHSEAVGLIAGEGLADVAEEALASPGGIGSRCASRSAPSDPGGSPTRRSRPTRTGRTPRRPWPTTTPSSSCTPAARSRGPRARS